METHELLMRRVTEAKDAHFHALLELSGAVGWLAENDELRPDRVREWLAKVDAAFDERRAAVDRLTAFHERAKGTPLFEAAS